MPDNIANSGDARAVCAVYGRREWCRVSTQARGYPSRTARAY